MTDYAGALAAFRARTLTVLGRNSVIIVLGDARNNQAPSGADQLHRCANRASACYWLNPERPALWNTGDSVLAEYAAHCSAVFELSTLDHLAHFCEYLLRPGKQRSTRQHVANAQVSGSADPRNG